MDFVLGVSLSYSHSDDSDCHLILKLVDDEVASTERAARLGR